MAEQGTGVNRERIKEEFKTLVSIDAPSYHEKAISEYLKEKLEGLGLDVTYDSAKEKLVAEAPGREDTSSNLYGYLKGTAQGDPVLFAVHMDTVDPGTGKKAVFHEDGRVTSDGDTVLGADDVSGIVSLIEALMVIKERKLSHPDIEVLITAAEEPYCSGSRFVEYERLKARKAYVLDLTGPVGTAALSAPSVISVEVKVTGRAAHAGFAPETGINALNIAVAALSKIRTGRVKKDLTVNFGTISGGTGRNIVPDNVRLQGEIRSLDHGKAMAEAGRIKKIFETAAAKAGGGVEVTVTEHVRAYKVPKNTRTVRHFANAAKKAGFAPKFTVTYGGSDANRFNQNGKDAIVIACAMENCHAKNEYTTVDELTRSAELTLALMTEN